MKFYNRSLLSWAYTSSMIIIVVHRTSLLSGGCDSSLRG
jgi:hypothetical protein